MSGQGVRDPHENDLVPGARHFSLVPGRDAALRKAVAGRQKSVAGEVWPDLPLSAAESRLARVLSGELGIPSRLPEVAFSASPEPLYEWVRATFPVRVELQERPWEETLARVGLQLERWNDVGEALVEEVRQARELKERAELAERERKGPIRVESAAHRDRRRA
jgi:hypothetical protein